VPEAAQAATEGEVRREEVLAEGHPAKGVDGTRRYASCIDQVSRWDDWPYFQDLGVRYSDLASAQVDAHVAAGWTTAVAPQVLVVLDTDLPDADISPTATVPADGVSVWPRDGFDPASCP
jgi:hypothetical protein